MASETNKLIDLLDDDNIPSRSYKRVSDIKEIGAALLSLNKLRVPNESMPPRSVREVQSGLEDRINGKLPILVRKVENTPEGWAENISRASLNKLRRSIGINHPSTSALLITAVTAIANEDKGFFDTASLSYFYLYVIWMKQRLSREASFMLMIDVPSVDSVWKIADQLRYLASCGSQDEVSVLVRCPSTDISHKHQLVCLNHNSLPKSPLRKIIPTLLICRDESIRTAKTLAPFAKNMILLQELQGGQSALEKKHLDTNPILLGSIELLIRDAATRPVSNLKLIVVKLLHSIYGILYKRVMDSERASSFYRHIIEKMQQHLLGTNLLAQLIFTETLYLAIESGFLVRRENSDVDETSNSLLDKMAFDALSYAEGLLQTVENSCLHTVHGISMVLLTIHEARILKESYSSIHQIERYRLRAKLEKNYISSLKVNAKERFSLPNASFLEMRTVDISEMYIGRGGEKRVERGFPRIFQAEHSGFVSPEPEVSKLGEPPVRGMKWLLSTIREGNSATEIVNHYGLALFTTVVLSNGGFLKVITPGIFSSERKNHDETVSTVKVVGLERYTCGLSESGRQCVSDKSIQQYGTWSEISALVPICSTWRDRASEKMGEGGVGDFYDERYVGMEYKELLRYVTFDNSIPKVSHNLPIDRNDIQQVFHLEQAGSKTIAVDRMAKELKDQILTKAGDASGSHGYIPLIDFAGTGLTETEIFSKGLFKCLAEDLDMYKCHHTRFLVVVFFRKRSLAYHFLRLFSIFYSRPMRTKQVVPFQVYVCTTSSSRQPTDIPEVNFVLSYANTRQAEKTAQVYCHYYASTTKDMLPFIEYLHAPDNSAKSGFDPIAPVELFLHAKIDDVGLCHADNADDSWYFRRLSQIVCGDAAHNDPGCRYAGVHMRIGTRIHVNDFYDCTAIFQNVTLVKGMAFLIASFALQELCAAETKQAPPTTPEVFLYGYEEISSLLITEAASLLQRSLRDKGYESANVGFLTYLKGGRRITNLDALSACFNNEDTQTAPLIMQVLPVGTTLSTLSKMRDALERRLSEAYELTLPEIHVDRTVIWNTSLEHSQSQTLLSCLRGLLSIRLDYRCAFVPILVAPDDTSTQANTFWRKDSVEGIVICPKGRGDRASIRARYFAKTQTHWSLADDCQVCHGVNEQYLASANDVGTAPRVHVGSLSQESESSATTVDESFRGCIDYGHIVSGANHIQYYVKPAAYFKSCEKRFLDRVKDLRKEVRLDAYNVIVAPMESEGSEFYASVLENVFDHSLRFIHIDLMGSTVDEIRLRYRSAIEDIAVVGRYRDVCFYFLQNVLSSGLTLMKAQTVVRMIRHEAGLPMSEKGPEFERVITLVDKSPSYVVQRGRGGTLGQPGWSVWAYKRLETPAHGLRAETCPVCESVHHLRSLSKSCAACDLAAEFLSLSKKRSGVNHDEYNHQLWKAIRTDKRILEWFLEYCEYAATSQLGTYDGTLLGLDVVDYKYIRKISETSLHFDEKMDDVRLLTISDLDIALQRVVEANDKFPMSCRDIFVDHVLALHNYMRLACDDELSRLFMNVSEPTALQDESTQVLSLFLSAIESRLVKTSNPYVAKEWLISYIKVAARGVLSQTLAVKQTLLSVSSYLVTSICGIDTSKSVTVNSGTPLINDAMLVRLERIVAYAVRSNKSPSASFSHIPSFVLRLLKTLLSRLAELGSCLLLETDNVIAIYSTLLSMEQQAALMRRHEEAATESENGNVEKIQIFMRRILKECAYSRGEVSSGARLATLSRELSVGDSSMEYAWLSQSLQFEATGPLFNGISRLLDVWCTVPLKETFLAIQQGGLDSIKAPYPNHPKLSAIKATYDNLFNRSEDMEAKALLSFIALNEHSLYEQCASKLIEIEWACAEREDGFDPHSPHADLFCFVSSEVSSRHELKKVKCEIAQMLLLMKYIRELEGRILIDMGPLNRPLRYEGICNCIRKLLCSAEIYLMQATGGVFTLLSRSSRNGNARNADKADDWFSAVVDDGLQEALRQLNTGEVSYSVGKLMVVPLSRDGIDEDTQITNGLYIVALYPDTETAERITANSWNLRNVLFARHSLVRALNADIPLLIDDVSDYESVCQLSDSEGGMRALHISDLHLPAFIDGYQQLEKYLSDRLNHRWINGRWVGDGQFLAKTYDLILVSGDIAMASKSPSNLTKNYEKAAGLLSALAAFLWSDRNGMLRGDWRKRIAIVTGNHDYAAMNDYEVMHLDRRRANDMGHASHARGTAMSQFLYLSRFLHDVLGESLSSLWLSSFNDVRNYNQLGVSLVLLNTSARVSALRTNKVGVPETLEPETLATRVNPRNRVIVISHHSPLYEIDYACDEYFDCSMSVHRTTVGKLTELTKIISKYVNDEHESIALPEPVDRSNLSEKWVQYALGVWLKGVIRSSGDKTKHILPLDTVRHSAVWDSPEAACERELKRTQLWKAAKRVADYDDSHVNNYGDEYLLDLAHKIILNNRATQRDYEEMQSFFGELLTNLTTGRRGGQRAVLSLSGHTHVGSADTFEDVLCTTVGRLLDCVFVTADESCDDSHDKEWLFAGAAVRKNEDPKLQVRYALRYGDVETIGSESMPALAYSAWGILFDANVCSVTCARTAGGYPKDDLSLQRYEIELHKSPSEEPENLAEHISNWYITEEWILPAG